MPCDIAVGRPSRLPGIQEVPAETGSGASPARPPVRARAAHGHEGISLAARLIRRVSPKVPGAYAKTHHHPKPDPRPIGQGAPSRYIAARRTHDSQRTLTRNHLLIIIAKRGFLKMLRLKIGMSMRPCCHWVTARLCRVVARSAAGLRVGFSAHGESIAESTSRDAVGAEDDGRRMRRRRRRNMCLRPRVSLKLAE